MSLTSKNLLFKSVVPRSLTIEQKAHSCSQQDAAALTRFSLAAPIPFSLFFFFFLVIIFQIAAAFVVLRC